VGKLRFGKPSVPTAKPRAVGAPIVGNGGCHGCFLSTPGCAGRPRGGQSTDSPAAPASDSGKVPEILVTAEAGARRTCKIRRFAVTAITGDGARRPRHIDDISNISAGGHQASISQSTNNAQGVLPI